MKYLILVSVLLSSHSNADFIDLSVYKKEQGVEAACELAKIKLKEVTNNFKKTYYKKYVSWCEHQKPEYKSLNRRDKNNRIRDDYDAAMVYLIEALENKEDATPELIERISVEAGSYPEINEGLTKLKIENVRNKKQGVPDVNEGDIHEIGPYIYGKYEGMANAYIMNGMFDEADRIISEYGQTVAGESGVSRLRESIERFRIRFEERL